MLVPLPVQAGDALDPYRAFARSGAGPALLATARAAMTAHFAPAPRWLPGMDPLPAPMDPTPTPGPPRAGSTAPEAAFLGDSTSPARALGDWPGAPVPVYLSVISGRATRACVGTPSPIGPTLESTVRALAVQALQADLRHPPVRADEIDALRMVISFAGPGEPLADPMRYRPGLEGLLVRTPRGSVAFLPGEARTVAWALREARRMGLTRGDPADVAYERFPVVSISEPQRRAARRTDAEK